MSKKLNRIETEITKAKKKRAEWDSKVRDLERKYREEENTEIHEIVRAANLTPAQLEQLLHLASGPKKQEISKLPESPEKEEWQNEE